MPSGGPSTPFRRLSSFESMLSCVCGENRRGYHADINFTYEFHRFNSKLRCQRCISWVETPLRLFTAPLDSLPSNGGIRGYLVCRGLCRKIQHDCAEPLPHTEQQFLLYCDGLPRASISGAQYMMPVVEQLMDKVLIPDCIHCRDDNGIECCIPWYRELFALLYGPGIFQQVCGWNYKPEDQLTVESTFYPNEHQLEYRLLQLLSTQSRRLIPLNVRRSSTRLLRIACWTTCFKTCQCWWGGIRVIIFKHTAASTVTVTDASSQLFRPPNTSHFDS